MGRKAGVVLLVAGLIWVLTWVFLDEPLFRIVALVLLLGGLSIGLLDRGPFPTRWPRLVRAIVTAGLVALAAWQWLPPRPEAEMEWAPYSTHAIEQAARAGRPVLIDFFADWCPPCHDLDRRVFGRKEVVEATASFVRLRADLSDRNSPATAAISERHIISALPTVVFIAPDGNELRSLRLVGFEPASRFLARLRAVK
jgi:thiol:disulfide interchange protein DsbD